MYEIHWIETIIPLRKNQDYSQVYNLPNQEYGW